jgi:hypothetical protein
MTLIWINTPQNFTLLSFFTHFVPVIPPTQITMPSAEVYKTKDSAVYTTSNGAPVNEPYAAQRVGLNGPLLLQGQRLSQLHSEYNSHPSQTSTILIFSHTLTASASQNVSYVCSVCASLCADVIDM